MGAPLSKQVQLFFGDVFSVSTSSSDYETTKTRAWLFVGLGFGVSESINIYIYIYLAVRIPFRNRNVSTVISSMWETARRKLCSGKLVVMGIQILLESLAAGFDPVQ